MPKLLSTSQAVFIGLASMLGAGVFTVFGPAAQFAGAYLPVSVLIAAALAYLNAMSIAQLAAVVSRSGGAYSYARQYISNTAGFLAGISFQIGKLGSIAAIALTFGTYASPGFEVLTAIGAIITMMLMNLAGINRTAFGAKVLASLTLSFLMVCIAIAATYEPVAVDPLPVPDIQGVLAASALMFFAFAGYARVATLAGEVANPNTSIPRAIKVSLGVVFALYFCLAFLLPQKLGVSLASSEVPLKDLVDLFQPSLGQLVWVFAASAALGSLLALLAGMGRTLSTMAEDGELPKALTLQNAKGAPWVAEVLLSSVGIALVSTGSFILLIGLSSFSVLIYYAVANYAAIKQPNEESSRAKIWNWLGLLACIAMAFSVPVQPLVLGLTTTIAVLVLRWGLAKVRTPR